MKVRQLFNWREIHRWATLRCAHCGHRFRWSQDARHSFSDASGKVYHGPCQSAIVWRNKAEEAYEVMRLILEVKEISQRDVTTIAELRAETEEERVAASNRVFRVLYNMNSIKIGAEQHDQ
jgi:hypothetical protein